MLQADLDHILNEHETINETKGNSIYISFSNNKERIERVKVRKLYFYDGGWMVEDSLNVGGFFRQQLYDLFADAMNNAEERLNEEHFCISLKRINPHYHRTIYTS